MKVRMFKQVLYKEVVSTLLASFMGMDIISGQGTLPPPSTVKSKPVDKVLMEATVRNVKVDGIKVEVCWRICMFEQALCEVVATLLPDYVMGMDTVSHWGMFPLPGIVKQKTCKSAVEAL